MSVIINRKIQDSRWSHLSDGDPPAAGNVTLSRDRWLREREHLRDRPGAVGLRLQPSDALEEIVPYLDELGMIALEFGTFTEGRGYSQAYLLRQRHGFGGEIRAIGARRDHVAYMERCGINAFEPAETETAEELLEGFDEITARYQPSSDGIALIFRERARGAQSDVQET